MVAALGGRLDLVRKLRARGADVNHKGWNALIYAATGGHDDVVRYLLAEGAQIDAASANGTTALMMAAREGRASTLDLLIARGRRQPPQQERRERPGLGAAGRGEPAMVDRLRRAGAR
jgi:ankyrin repeat protein